MTHLREHFPQPSEPLMLLDVGLLLRPPAHAPTLADAIAALCDGHGEVAGDHV